MRTIEKTIYNFSELSERAKERARQWYREGVELDHCWEYVKDDAANIGLNVISLDDSRPNKGEFKTSAKDCALKIMREHGETCETYKDAARFLLARHNAKHGERETLDDDFLRELLEDYRIMLNADIEYNLSDEAVDEMIDANGYEFDESGVIV